MIALETDHLLRLRTLSRAASVGRGVTALPGGLVTRARGRGLETADIRGFAHGDDPRHIDRNATARTGQLQVRTFHAERDRTLLLLADFRPSMLWGTRRTLRSIAGAEALCLAGWQAVSDGGRVALIAAWAGGHATVRARGRDRGMVAVIGGMVRAHAAAVETGDRDDPDLSETVAMAERLCPRGGEVLLASAFDNPGEDLAEALTALRRRCTVSVLRIADAFELAPPPGRYRFRTRAGLAASARPTEAGAGLSSASEALFGAGVPWRVYPSEPWPDQADARHPVAARA